MAPTDLAFGEAVQRHGFAVVESVVPATRVSELAQHLAAPAIKHTRAGARHLMRDQEIASFANDEDIKKLAIEVLGYGAFPFRATLFDKSPGANWLVAWHQDTALPLAERFEASEWSSWSLKDGIHYANAPTSVLQQVVALRVSLDDSTLSGGPLRVLPGTHRQGVLREDQILKLSAETSPFNCIVDRGGVVAMRPLIVHASSKATDSQRRRVLHIEYAAQPLSASGIRLAIA